MVTTSPVRQLVPIIWTTPSCAGSLSAIKPSGVLASGRAGPRCLSPAISDHDRTRAKAYEESLLMGVGIGHISFHNVYNFYNKDGQTAVVESLHQASEGGPG